MRFKGYRRKDGSVGVRNIVAIISCTGCINEVPKLISQGIPGTIPLGHNLSYSHLGTDLERSIWTLTNLAGNPKVYGVVLVGMGCEQMSPEKIYQSVLQFEKPVELFCTLSTPALWAWIRQENGQCQFCYPKPLRDGMITLLCITLVSKLWQ